MSWVVDDLVVPIGSGLGLGDDGLVHGEVLLGDEAASTLHLLVNSLGDPALIENLGAFPRDGP